MNVNNILLLAKIHAMKDLVKMKKLQDYNVITDIVNEANNVYFNMHITENKKLELLNELYKESMELIDYLMPAIFEEVELLYDLEAEIKLDRDKIIHDKFNIYDFYDKERLLINEDKTILLQWEEDLKQDKELWLFVKTRPRYIFKYLNNFITLENLKNNAEEIYYVVRKNCNLFVKY